VYNQIRGLATRLDWSIMRLGIPLLLIFLLTACGPNVVVQSPLQPTQTPWPTGQIAVRTLVPAKTDPPGKLALPLGATDYPAPQETAAVPGSPAYPYPISSPNPATQGLQPGASPNAAAFHDCVRTPGLPGCDHQALPLTGRLALIDQSAGRTVVLDLSTGKGWQTRSYTGISWSPDASQLLAWQTNDGGQQNDQWSASGEYQAANPQDQILAWQQDGSLAPRDTLRYPDGTAYQLTRSADDKVLLRIHPSAGQESTMTVDDQPADRQYLLLERIPGTENLLAQSFFPSNLGTSAGGSLLLIDPQKEKLQPLGVDAPLPPEANLAWSPAAPMLLAFTASGAEPGMAILSLYDFATMNFSQPLPDGVQVSSLDWRPDGKVLAFSAEPLPGVISAQDKQAYPSAGVYLYDSQTGKVSQVLLAPQDASIGWVRWSADGSILLYGRLIRSAAGKPGGEVHAYALKEHRDVTLFNSLTLAQAPQSQAPWQMILSYAR
jgi:dipeptidyl aminopeptidase/acylaminoacyl peptidase